MIHTFASSLATTASPSSMLGPEEFREIVSGRRRSVSATALRGLLRVGETPYTFAVQWRNHRFDNGRAAIHRVGVPVVSVGNLTLGGTGKTPIVKWLARWWRRRNIRVAIVSRGYGASAGHKNDEALELHKSLPEVPHAQNPDRVSAARRAIDEFRSQLILLDDGFQHRRLARDLDIVLLDALEPFGFDHVFPRGTLREPLAGLHRANVVCLSRADVVSHVDRDAIRRRVAQLAPHAAWCELSHAANGLINSSGDTPTLESLTGRRVVAFCGIGNPAGFRHTLAAAGCEAITFRTFPDHHSYSQADLESLGAMAITLRADMLVCTQKDLVKIGRSDVAGVPLWAVAIEIQFLSGQDLLERSLELITAQIYLPSER